MLGKKESWFHRNRGFILGFALVVAVLNIALLIAMPTESAVHFAGEVQEYTVLDESPVCSHTVELTGTLTSRTFRPTEFAGTLCLDGAEWGLAGARADGVWELAVTAPENGADAPQILAVRGDREMTSVVVLLEKGENAHFLSLYAGNRAAALRGFETYYADEMRAMQ